MKIQSKNKIIGFLIGIIVLMLITGCAQTQVAGPTEEVTQEKEEYVIGSIMPLSGDAGAYGLPMQQAADLAVEEINNAGGINGKPLRIIYEDGVCTAKGGSTAAHKLISIDNVKVILGGVCSGETLGAAPVAEAAKVILFSPGSGSPDITAAGDYIFRDFPSDATSGNKVAIAAIEKGHTKVAILSEQTDYVQALKTVFKETFIREGGTILLDEMFASESTDFRTALTKIKAANPDAVYLVAQIPSRTGLVLKQVGEMGIDQPLYTNEFAAAEEILTDYSKEIEGAIYAEPMFDENTAKAFEFLENLKAKYGEVSGALPPIYYATTYDGVYILKEAIEACGEDTDCIKTSLYSVKFRNGAAGLLSIDSNGDAEFEYELKQIKNNEPTVIS